MRTTVPNSRRVCFWLCAVALVCVALLFGACLIKADYDSIRQESTISVPSDSRTEKALESMAKAFHGWDR